jgi:uncharacterized membrane protein YgcG
MVLDAISRGMKSIGKIASVTKMNKAQVEMIVNDLVAQRMIVITEKKGFFGNKKQEITITDTGMRVLMTKKQELNQKFQQYQQWYANGQSQQMQNSMGSDRMWLPFMLFSGIMNAVFFMSMMSMMGAALTPAESAAASDAGADTSGAGGDAGADAGGADGGGGGGADAGGGDFGGDMGGDFGF